MNNSVLYKYFELNLYQVDFAQRHMSRNYAFVYIFMHIYKIPELFPNYLFIYNITYI